MPNDVWFLVSRLTVILFFTLIGCLVPELRQDEQRNKMKVTFLAASQPHCKYMLVT